MIKFTKKAEELGISYSNLYKMILKKEVECIFICGSYYFKSEGKRIFNYGI